MIYEKAVPFKGSLERAPDIAASTLTEAGYEIVEHSQESVTCVAVSTNRPRFYQPLSFCSSVRFDHNGTQLRLEARLGRLHDYNRSWAICGVLSAVVITYAMFAGEHPIQGGLTLMMLVLLVPYIVGRNKARTYRNLDALLLNMARMGERGIEEHNPERIH